MIVEIIGYIGSFLVLISFLMTSVFKLRVVNSIGSVIFMIYALIIKSYPTAIMNFCLVLINIYYLWKMSHTHKTYTLLKSDIDDNYLQYFLDFYHDDIKSCFNNQTFDFNKNDEAYFICYGSNPLGLTIGHRQEDTLDLKLDYSIPEYRDFSIGEFLYDKLKQEGIKKVKYSGSVEHHLEYLNKLNFKKVEDHYEKVL